MSFFRSSGGGLTACIGMTVCFSGCGWMFGGGSGLVMMVRGSRLVIFGCRCCCLAGHTVYCGRTVLIRGHSWSWLMVIRGRS